MDRELRGATHANYGSTSDEPNVQYSDGNRELETTCGNISTNIYTINNCTKNLQAVYSKLGTTSDSEGLREEIHVWQLSANQMAKVTSGYVTNLSNLSRGASKAQRLQANKISNHFQEAVNNYHAWQVKVAEKLKRSLPRQASMESDEVPLVDDEVRQQLQVQQQLQFETEMALESEQRIRQIEGDILNVNELMKELHVEVLRQGEQVETIESHIESTRADVEAASSQLLNANTYVNRSRKRNIILLAILVTVLAILIGIIVWSSR